jgi:DNA-binding CsgD family transcriptional regulator
LLVLDQLGAAPLAARVRDTMRASGFKAVPRGPMHATRANPAGLTRREVEVLQLLAQELRPAQIAARMSRSIRTVEHHVESLYAKLEVSTRAQALSRAQALGVLDEK